MFGIGVKNLNPFSGLVNRDIVAIDFSGNNLKLAHLKVSPARKELMHLVSHSIAGLPDDEISRIVRSSFNDIKAATPDVIDIISPNLVITKNIEIPSTDQQEIREIMNLQAGRHTPYSRDEIIIDYINIGTFKHNYTKILLVMVANNVIQRQVAILNKAGLRLEKVLFASEGLARSLTKIFKIDLLDAPTVVLHIDEIFTDFTVIFKDKVTFVRSIPIGIQHLSGEPERYQARFIEEIKGSLEAYQSEDIEKGPGMLILTGAVEEAKNLEPALNDALHLPIRITPYLKNLAVSEEALKTASDARHLSFLNIIAPLLSYEDLKINLIPEEIKLKNTFEEKGKDLIKTGIFILTAIVLVFSILISKIYFKSAYLKTLDKEFQSLNQNAKKLEGDFTAVSLIRNYLTKRGFALEVLAELYNLTPDELALTDIRYDEQGKFSIRGTAETMSAVFSFVGKMASTWWSSIR